VEYHEKVDRDTDQAKRAFHMWRLPANTEFRAASVGSFLAETAVSADLDDSCTFAMCRARPQTHRDQTFATVRPVRIIHSK
jgi:hypothetical protein